VRHVSVQQLSAFTDGALSGVSRELVVRHLATCSACRDRQGAWQAADEALRQALSWTPNERTLEEWSSRVELCITAERKGLPVPEFTPTLLPVIAAVTPTTLPRMRELLEGARGAMLSKGRGTKPERPAGAKPVAGAPAPEPPDEPAGSSLESAKPVPEEAPELAPAEARAPAVPSIENSSSTEAAPTHETEHEAGPAASEVDDVASEAGPEPVAEEASLAEPEPSPVAEATTESEPVSVAEPEVEAEPAPVAGSETEAEPAPVAGSETEAEPAPEPVAEQDSGPERLPDVELATEAALPTVAESEVEPEPEQKSVAAAQPDPAPAPVAYSEPTLPRAELPVALPVASTKRDPFLELKPLPELTEPLFTSASLPESTLARAMRRHANATPPGTDPVRKPAHVAVPAPVAPAAARPLRRRGRRRLLAACTVLLLVLLTSMFMPDVIRIPLPERWRPRVPRVEFVRRGGTLAETPAASRDAAFELATSQPIVPELVSQPAVAVSADSLAPADSVATPVTGEATSPAVTSAPASPSTAVATVARPPAPARAPARTAPARPATGTSERPSSEAEFVPDNPSTIIPVRVTTSVRLSKPPARALPEPEHDESWPLLCGEVIDAQGQPVEGARVQLVSPALTVRTDRRGRFCVACPPGVRALRVEAPGLPVVNRTVELTGGMVETRIALPPAR